MNRLLFLDFGLTGRLTREMQDTIVSLFLGCRFSGCGNGCIDVVQSRSDSRARRPAQFSTGNRSFNDALTWVEYGGVGRAFKLG